MKRIVYILCALALLLSLGACGRKNQNFYPTPEDVTVESLKERTTPQTMLGFEGGVQVDFRNEDIINAGAYASTTSFRYRYDGEKVLIGQMVDFDNGEYTHIYFDSNLREPYMFIADDREETVQITPLIDRETQNALYNSLFFCTSFSTSGSRRRPDTASRIPHELQISVLLSVLLIAGGSAYSSPQIGHVLIVLFLL